MHRIRRLPTLQGGYYREYPLLWTLSPYYGVYPPLCKVILFFIGKNFFPYNNENFNKNISIFKKISKYYRKKTFFPIEFEILGKILQFFLNLKYYRKKKIFSYKKREKLYKMGKGKNFHKKFFYKMDFFPINGGIKCIIWGDKVHKRGIFSIITPVETKDAAQSGGSPINFFESQNRVIFRSQRW